MGWPTIPDEQLWALPAFQEGKNACILTNCQPRLVKNPYPKDTNEFYAWNVGWNHAIFSG